MSTAPTVYDLRLAAAMSAISRAVPLPDYVMQIRRFVLWDISRVWHTADERTSEYRTAMDVILELEHFAHSMQ